MSRQIPGTNIERDSNSPPAFGADHNDNDQDFGSASQSRRHTRPQPYHDDNDWCATFFVPFHQPVADHSYAPFPQQVARANGTFPHAQAEHHAGPHYPCQNNAWNHATANVYRPGGINLDAGFYDPFNFPYDGIATEPVMPVASTVPVWDFNGNPDFDQSSSFITSGAQLNAAPYSAMVPAPPAPVPAPAPAPAPAAADRIRCPHGCPATFGRGGEYRRHMMIHEPARYRCPIVDCPKTFSRADKLRDHAKRGHGGRNPLNL